MIADTSQSTFLFPLSNHCCALDPVLQQIHSKHSDRCIHKAQLWTQECALALHWPICQRKICQGSPFLYSPCHWVGKVKLDRSIRVLKTKSSRAKLTSNLRHEHKRKWQLVFSCCHMCSVHLNYLNQLNKPFEQSVEGFIQLHVTSVKCSVYQTLHEDVFISTRLHLVVWFWFCWVFYYDGFFHVLSNSYLIDSSVVIYPN